MRPVCLILFFAGIALAETCDPPHESRNFCKLFRTRARSAVRPLKSSSAPAQMISG